MGKKPESRLQNKIRQDLEKEFPGSWWRKIHGGPYQKKGIPDLLGCVEGNFFGIEVKCPKGSPATDLQQAVLKQIDKAGGCSCIVTSSKEAIDVVRRII